MASAKPAIAWWNRIKKSGYLFTSALGFLLLGFVFVSRLLGPKIGNTFCTMAGCFGGLGIVVEGLPNGTMYNLDIQYIHGHEQTLTCEAGKVDADEPVSPFVNGCVMHGAAFTLDMDEKPPEEIKVTLTANGKTVTKVFHPTYQEDRPNGEDCPPVCYSSTIVMDASQ